jgi:phenylalanyl-tRNA synthetase beta chain
MQFSESWLREFCNPNLTTSELAETLTMAGLEVEELNPVASAFHGVVVGKICAVVQHPNADRLRVCQVDVGQTQLLTIVCGASNARVGIKVACALVGAELPTGDDGQFFSIKIEKLRGIESFGMLCSARELKLSQENDGLLELKSDAQVGQDIRHHLQLDDTMFTLKLTPNLAHVLSVFGVARELSALTGAQLKIPSFGTTPVSINEVLKVKISAVDLCGRFSGRVIRGLNPDAKTPTWMVNKLLRCGQRSVSALVDISNFVMFELGRPSHIFDLNKIHDGLDVRWGKLGEKLKLLNGSTITVDAQVGVIADAIQVESLAGIMGGEATAVGTETHNIYLEAAFWWPKSIVGRSRRFNFSTDAGHRFERGVDPEMTIEHIERITQLIIDICGTAETVCGPIDDQKVNMPLPAKVALRIARASKVLGMPLTQTQCAQALTGLGLDVVQGDHVLYVTPPTYRFDLKIEEDLIEEVARVIGYENLPISPPHSPIVAKIRPENLRSEYALRRSAAALGYQETINFSFVEERWEHELAGNLNPIKLLNPIASQMSVMRSSLLGSLLQVLKFNQDRKVQRVRIFEIGRIFLRDETVNHTDQTVKGFHQPMRLAGLAVGASDSVHWSRKDRASDFFDVKGDLEALFAPRSLSFEPAHHPAMHPGRSAKVLFNKNEIGILGELHPKWRNSYELSSNVVLFEIDFSTLMERDIPCFQPVPKFQAVERDIAVLVEEHVTHDSLMRAIFSAPVKDVLRDAFLFDIYRPKSTEIINIGVQTRPLKSMGVRLTLQAVDTTLSESQIDQTVALILGVLFENIGARQRV